MKKIWNVIFVLAFIIVNYFIASKFNARIVIDKPIIDPINNYNVITSILYVFGLLFIAVIAGYQNNRSVLITAICCLTFAFMGFLLTFLVPLIGIIAMVIFLPAIQGISFDNGIIELLIFALLPILFWKCFDLGKYIKNRFNKCV